MILETGQNLLYFAMISNSWASIKLRMPTRGVYGPLNMDNAIGEKTSF